MIDLRGCNNVPSPSLDCRVKYYVLEEFCGKIADIICYLEVKK
jgi:hypothetical protein